MRLIRELRLVPIVLFAAVCLLALKVLGFIAEDRVALADIDFRSSSIDKTVPAPARGDPAPSSTAPRPKGSWASEMFNFPDVTGSIVSEKTVEKKTEKSGDKDKEKDKDKAKGSAGHKGDDKNAGEKAEPVPAGVGGRLVPLNPQLPPGERALLERLQERRQELDTRARELEIRESLLKAAESASGTAPGDEVGAGERPDPCR